MTQLLKLIHRLCCEQFHVGINLLHQPTKSLLREKNFCSWRLARHTSYSYSSSEDNAIDYTYASFYVIFLHESIHNSVCGLSSVTGSWLLERDIAVQFLKIYFCFGFVSSTSRVLSCSIILERRQTSLQLTVANNMHFFFFITVAVSVLCSSQFN